MRSLLRTTDVRVVESKGCFSLVVADLTRDFGHVTVESTADVVVVTEDERLFQVEPDGDDIARVSKRKSACLLDLEFVLEQELLVVYGTPLATRQNGYRGHSPVNWTTRGTSKTSCNHLEESSTQAHRGINATHFVKTKGTICPKCMLSLLGPRPVYKKKGFPCS